MPSMTHYASRHSLSFSAAAGASLLAAAAFGLSWPKTDRPPPSAKARAVKRIDARMFDTALTPDREAEHVSAEVLQRHESSSKANGIRQAKLTDSPAPLRRAITRYLEP